MIDTSKLATKIVTTHNALIERKLVEMVEKHLGRVPSNNEVAAHGMCRIDWPERGSNAYFWDDHLLFAFRTYYDHPTMTFRLEVKQP